MKYTFSSSLRHVVSEYIWLWQSISKTLGVVACFFLHLQEHLQEGAHFGNEVCLLKFLPSCSFRIYMVIAVYLQNPRSGCLFFSCTFRSTFRREMPFGNEIYLLKFLTSSSFRIYMVMAVYLQNPRSGCLFFPAPSGAPSGGRRPLEMKYTYSSSLRHAI